jgi:hypothetical protein
MLATRRSISHDGVGIPGVVGVYDRPRCVLLSRQTGRVLGAKQIYAIVLTTGCALGKDVPWRGGIAGTDKTLIQVQADPDIARLCIGTCKWLGSDKEGQRGSKQVEELHDN